MNTVEPPTEGVKMPPLAFEMYLLGNEDGDVEIICDHPRCMREGHATEHNPDGLWLQDVGALPYRPSALEVITAWHRHIAEHHRMAGSE